MNCESALKKRLRKLRKPKKSEIFKKKCGPING
jgi:hypothetical protein